jgi:uncharacterized protein YwgA
MTIDIPTFIDAAGGEVAGKVRLQKLMYLVDQLGIVTGFSFNYHHYGPYSEELAERVEDDVVFGRVSVEQKRRADGVPFVIYRPRHHNQDDPKSLLRTPGVRAALSAMQRRSATVLELAATIHWLAFVEEVDNWQAELVRRKGVKTEHGRAEAALGLLVEMQIAPA